MVFISDYECFPAINDFNNQLKSCIPVTNNRIWRDIRVNMTFRLTCSWSSVMEDEGGEGGLPKLDIFIWVPKVFPIIVIHKSFSSGPIA